MVISKIVGKGKERIQLKNELYLFWHIEDGKILPGGPVHAGANYTIPDGAIRVMIREVPPS